MACQYRMRNELQELFERAPWYDEESKVRLNLSTMFAYSQRIFPNVANSLRLFPFEGSELRTIGNIPMIHHLLKKLPPPHILDVLKELLQRKEFLSDDDRICLFNQDVTILEQLFRRIPFCILMFLLQWPLQTQFLEVVHRLWSHLTKEEFFKLLLSIHSKIEKGWRDFDYINLIKTFWSRSPHHFQDYVQKKNISEQEEFSMHEFDIINNFWKNISLEEK
ncbi:hypothetical protein TNCT_66872 [Trichonephila clavata]|nr:hypothetical protein TNCT_66872 [Trichonephila clavata]